MKKLLLLSFVFYFSSPAFAQLQDIRGVIPTENITSLEIKPRYKAKDDSKNKTLATLELKPSFKLNRHWKFGAEIPLSRYGNGETSHKGMGDLTLSALYTEYSDNKSFSYGLGSELILPTATNRELGDGKVYAEPEVFLVWKITPNFFVETEYRHIFSFAGADGREDINKSRYRMILGYMSDSKWWVEFDPRYTVDYQNKSEAELIGEFEIGTMINTGSSVYLRGGWHLAGNKYSQDWEIMLGYKILYL